MWNPPWLMILMWPALRTSFETSALSWFLLQIVLLCGITAMAPVALGRTGLSLLARGAITVSFYPILECLGWGQLSIALTFTLFASLWLASLKSYFAAGVAIAPLTTKPHLFFLCAVPALMWLKDLDRSSRSRFFLGAVVSLGALAGGAEYMWPNSTSWWVESMMHPHLQPGTTSFAMWQTATITTCVRKLCELASGTVPMWPLWAVPTIAFTATCAIVWLNRDKLVLQTLAPAILCLSLVTSNYGWLYDYSLLLPVQFLIVYRALETTTGRSARFIIISATAGIQLTAFALGSFTTSSQLSFTWLPLAIFAVHIFSQRTRGV